MWGRLTQWALVGGLAAAGLWTSGCTACGKPAPKAEAPRVVRAGGPAMIDIAPPNDVNPVKTQHILVATVRDAQGTPISGVEVEWILARAGQMSVGDVVDVDGGNKVDNTYAKSVTGSRSYTIDRGNDDPADDVTVGPGQTWLVITSPVEGTTNIVAYAPAIRNWDHHKAFATKNWMDVSWEAPVDAWNRVGTPHTFTFRVFRFSDGTPLQNYNVNWRVLSGPAGTLSAGGTTKTDGAGVSSVTLNQSSPMEGTNEIEITVVRPEIKDECVCWPEALIGTWRVRKHWLAPKIGIEKSAPARATVNQNFEYQLLVTNPHPDLEVREVMVTDPLPSGIEYVASSPSAQVSGQTLTWNLGTIEAGGSRALSITVQATRKGTFENCADVRAEGGLTARDCAVTEVSAPAITLEKSGPDQVLVCDPITYRLVVRNTGDGEAMEVRVSDRLPAGMTCPETAGDTLEFFVGTLEPGGSREFTYTARVTRSGAYTNNATATGAGGLSAQASHTVTAYQPVLAITKTASRPDIKTGRPIQFDITVSSTGDVTARDVILEDAIPAGTTFQSASDGGMLSGNTVVWNLGTLDRGQSRKVSMTVIANQDGTIRNVAVARAYCAEEVRAEATVVVSGVAAILLEMIDLDDPLEVGGTTTYVIDVTNQGFADDRNVKIDTVLPPEMEFISAEGADGVAHTVTGKNVSFAPVPVIRAQERKTWRVTVRATGTGDVRFAVKLNSDMLDTSVDETESTHIY